MGVKKLYGITVDPSMNQNKGKNVNFVLIPVYSEQPDEQGNYEIIRYVREYV